MNESIEFDLEKNVSLWIENNLTKPEITTSDKEEVKSHLFDLIEKLKKKELDDHEAFWIATHRIGDYTVWKDEFQKMNNPIIQMRNSLIILGGVLAYFFFYYLIGFSSKMLFVILMYADKGETLSLEWVSRYLITFQFIFLLLFVSLFFLERKIISLIESIKFKPKHTLIFLLITILFAVVDTSIYPIAKNLLANNYALRGQLHQAYLYFGYSFPLLISSGFILIYFKY